MSKIEIRDLVIFVPGILGSVLSKDGVPVWGTRGRTLAAALAGNAWHALALPDLDSGKFDLGDGIKPTGLLTNIGIVPGLWKLGGYTRIWQSLRETPGLVVGENLFEFPYDWRRDNRLAAVLLQERADAWLDAWRSKSGVAQAKVIIVAHSMGGLIARRYIECMQGWRHTRMLVAVGTPFRGSGRALDFLVNGASLPAALAGQAGKLEPFRDFESLYQLLPTYRFVKTRLGSLQKIDEAGYLPLDKARVAAGLAFHREIETAISENVRDESYRLDGPSLRTVIGVAQTTAQSALWEDGRLSVVSTWEGNNPEGDDTVPRQFATPIGYEENVATFVANTHAMLPDDNATLSHVTALLASPALDLNSFRAERVSQSKIEVDEVVQAGTATHVRVVVDPQNEGPLTATVENGGEPIEQVMLERTGKAEFSADIALPAGDYAVRVLIGASEIGDVFAVVD